VGSSFYHLLKAGYPQPNTMGSSANPSLSALANQMRASTISACRPKVNYISFFMFSFFVLTFLNLFDHPMANIGTLEL
jgi:hypothetical protein